MLKPFLAYGMLTCCVLSVVIGWLLWSRKQMNQYANRLLAALLIVAAYIILVRVLLEDGGIRYVPHLFRTAAPLNYLIGPLIYLYVRASLLSITRPNYRRYAWLFLPFLLNVLEFMPFYLQSADYKLARLQALEIPSNSLLMFTEGVLPPYVHPLGYSLSNFVYSVLAARLWWRYRWREGQNQHSNPVFANWLRTFVCIELLVNGLWLLELPFIQHTAYGNLTVNITYTIAQLVICLYIIQRPALLYGAYTLPAPALPVADSVRPVVRRHDQPDEVADTGLPEQDIRLKLNQLDQYMRHEQPYLRPRLSLADVSVATQIPPYLLSAMLNRSVGLDFRDYVNSYRVRHLCELLESNQYGHLTLEGLSTQAGFSSKTTFYRAFQKHTGITPAQYLTKHAPAP